MAHTSITFEDTYWIYEGNVPMELKGLTIGGFESSFFANLVAAYILENSRELFLDTIYNGIQSDDALRVTDGKKIIDKLIDWIHHF